MKFPWIFAEKANHSVVRMFRALGVSRSGYYAWTTREESVRSKANRALDEQVRKAHADSRGTYGSPRVHRALKKQAFPAGRHRVARAMRRLGIMARRRRRFVVTTRSDPSLGVAPDRVGRGFWPAALNTLWATDITYLATAEGWLFLAVVLDLFSRKVVGWAMAPNMDTPLVLKALDMALVARRPAAGLIHHSDRGSQYASADYVRALVARGILPSMSRKGNCWDNAVVESFFASLKAESLADTSLPTRAEARTAVLTGCCSTIAPAGTHRWSVCHPRSLSTRPSSSGLQANKPVH